MAKQRHPLKSLSLPVYIHQVFRNPLSAGKPQNNVTLIVPSGSLLFTSIALPKLSRHRLLQALPYALEDQLIDDVSTLHFATGPRLPEGKWPVAVIAKNLMQTWVDAAQKAGFLLSQMIPDIFTLPFSPGQWTIDLDDTLCVARTGAFSGFSCHRTNLTAFLNAALKEIPTRPLRIQMRFFSDNMTQLLPTLTDVTFEKTPVNPQEKALLAQKVLTMHPFIDLLQNDWTAGKEIRHKTLWRTAGILTGVAVSVFSAAQITELTALRHQNETLKKDINRIYYHYFPKATAVIAPRERFQEKLAAAKGTGFLDLMSRVADPLSSHPGIQPESIGYQNHELQLDLSAPTFNDLDILIRAMTATGLQVKQQNAITTQNGVRAILIIRSQP